MEVKNDKPGSLSPVRSLRKRDSDDGRSTRSGSAKSERDVRLPPEKSPCDDKELRKDRRLSRSSDSSKDTFERQDSSITSPKVSRKYFTNWRQACDKTKDKTKDFLKRWRTLPEAESSVDEAMEPATNGEEHRGWSVHVWSKKSRQKSSKKSLNPDKTVRKTRKSNVKEKGFYNFKNMLNRSIMKQALETRASQIGRMKNSKSSRIMSAKLGNRD